MIIISLLLLYNRFFGLLIAALCTALKGSSYESMYNFSAHTTHTPRDKQEGASIGSSQVEVEFVALLKIARAPFQF
jgi:hypothetical protein